MRDMKRYVNNTSTEIRLVNGDIRDAKARFVVIGRNEMLRNHYQQLIGKPYSKLSGWMQELPVQVCRAGDLSLGVLATTYRPSDSTRHVIRQVHDLQSAIEYPLAHLLSQCGATEIAMAPISCREPAVVAMGMIQIIWDISVAAFLNVQGPLKDSKPTAFTIYCNADITPFVDVLEHGHYSSMRNGWLFNTEVRCNRAKLTRYLARGRFKYRRATDG